MQITKIITQLKLIALGLLISQTSFAQENFLPGYIISLKGDTLKGFIDYRNWDKNPNKIYFQNKLGSEKINYTPTNIKQFNVKDEIYVSAIVKAEVSPVEIDALEFDSELKIKIDTTFLQTMFQGTKCLYYYKNHNGRENFYIKQDTTFDLLVYKKYVDKQDDGNAIRENGLFINQLSHYLQSCPSIQVKLADTKYSKKSLERLFSYYYDYTKFEKSFQKKTEKLAVEIGALAGISVTRLKFHGDAFAYLVNGNYPSSSNFSTGLFLNIILPRTQRKWSINNELVFTSYKMNGYYNDYKNDNQYTLYYTKLGYSYLKMYNMLRFTLPIQSLFCYLNAGISNGIVVSESNYLKQEATFYTTKTIEESKALNDSRKHEQGYILGIGIKYKKYLLDIKYEKGNGMSENTALNSSTDTYYFLLGYRF